MSKLQYPTGKNDVSACRKAVSTAINSFQTARNEVQIAIVMLLSHAVRHGNNQIDLVNDLCNGLQGARSDLVAGMFTDLGGYTRQPGESGFSNWKGTDFIKAACTVEVNGVSQQFENRLDAAKAIMWWDRAPASPFSNFVLKDKLKSLLKTASKKMDELSALQASGEAPEGAKVDITLDDEILQMLVNATSFDHLIIHSNRVEVQSVDDGSANDSEESADEPAAAIA